MLPWVVESDPLLQMQTSLDKVAERKQYSSQSEVGAKKVDRVVLP
jgi:hypothetical protein